jgi:RecA/RadA recombinase
MEKIPTQCKAVDLLLNGGLASGTVTQFFGEKAEGKSLLSLQTAFATVASGSSAVILDTEQSYKSYLLESWNEPLSKRFGKEIPIVEIELKRVSWDKENKDKKKHVPRSQVISAFASSMNRLEVPYTDLQLEEAVDIFASDLYIEPLEVKQPSVVLIQVPSVTDLIGLHGVTAGTAVSEGGRVELHLLRTPSYNSLLRRLVKETKAKLLVYDSISAPFKASFPSTQDLPARSSGLSMMLSHAQRLCIEFGIAVVTVSHVSVNPIHDWLTRPYGGAILGYEAKFSLELTSENRAKEEKMVCVNREDESKEAKRAWLARHPAAASMARFGYMNFDDEGIR